MKRQVLKQNRASNRAPPNDEDDDSGEDWILKIIQEEKYTQHFYEAILSIHTLKNDDDENNTLLRIQQLVKLGANVNATSTSGRNCLHYLGLHWSDKRNAALNKNVLDLLLAAGASPNQIDKEGRSPMMLAAISCNSDYRVFVEKMIDAGTAVDKSDSQGRTSLHYAAYHGKTDVVQILLKAGASPDTVDAEGATILHHACLRGDQEIVTMLLSSGALLSDVDIYGHNALMHAVRSGNVKLVRQLIDEGMDVNYVIESDPRSNPELRSNLNRTVLHHAVVDDNVSMMEFLLENGADPNRFNDFGESIISFTLKIKPAHIHSLLKLLLKHGADMYTGGFNNPVSPFEYFLSNNKVSEVRILLEQGLDLVRYTPQTPDDFSPLHQAILCSATGDAKMLKLLLQYNTRGLFNLDHLILKRSGSACVKLLIESGADLEYVDSKGRTPLELAAEKAISMRYSFSSENFQFLVEAGARIRNVLGMLADNDVDYISDDLEDYNGADYRRSSRLWNAKCIVRYRILYESLNLVTEPMENGNMGQSVLVREFFEKCKAGIVLLKNTTLHGSISYYDVLVGWKDFYKRVRNDRVYETLTKSLSSSFERFPAYGTMVLNDRVRKIMAMHIIWEKAVEKLSLYMNIGSSETIYLIILNVLNYLSEDSLQSLAES
ncbi:hypothetical protein QAD02_010700 [Eretmocerus hayati]|uniref:Uncharacterized protein n=1 Tax=Eretmocerus hayati TaxID=131215 RepID=A0ACC2NX98_9HYME|nr:hypothetical protein QAD02_010700 [Eretmocerus hayati]